MSQANITQYRKADLAFYKAYQIQRSAYNTEIAIHVLIAIAIFVFILIDATVLKTGDKIIAALAVALAAALLSIIAWSYQRYVKFTEPGVKGYCQRARDTLHETEQVIMSSESEQNCTSETMLDAGTGVQIAGVPQKTINVFAKMARFQLQQVNEVRYSLSGFQRAEYFGGITAMTVVVILMSTSDHMNPAEIAILVCYLVLEAFSKWIFIVMLILFALSPILCLILCFCLCCCIQKEAQLALDIQPIKATPDHVVKCDGECAICLMSINPGESIYQLPCSDKHIFHKGCLEKWASVKKTCPTCRKEIPTKQVADGAAGPPIRESQQ